MKAHYYLSKEIPYWGSTVQAVCYTLVPNAQPVMECSTGITCPLCQEMLPEVTQRMRGVHIFAIVVNDQEFRISGEQ